MAKKGDKVLLIVLLISVIGIFGYMYLSRLGKDINQAIIEVEGREYQVINLRPNNQKQIIEIRQPNGQLNIVEVEGDEIKMAEANCPDKICLLMGNIRLHGQTVVCLPNKVVIRIKGQKDELDGITY